MANFSARMERIKPPRWVHVRFPRGAMFGEPGGKVELSYRWEAPPVAWRGREITEGP